MLYPVLQDPLHPIVSSLFDRPRGVNIGQMLFGAGEHGCWYDVADMSTLFQDSAGATPVTAVEQQVGLILDKSGRGNHATQVTATKRPVYSRRVNLLTNTEQFDHGAWQKSDGAIVATVTANTDTAPDGTLTADTFVPTVSGAYIVQSISGKSVTSGMKIVAGIYTKSATRIIVFGGSTPSGTDVYSIQTLAGGWYLQQVVRTFTVTATGSIQHVLTGLYAGAGSYVIWGASVTLATDAHLPYQRVNTATDYDADPSKFPTYLRYDGIDDGATSPTGGGGTAGFFYSSAITVAGGAGTARTLFSDAGTNTGYIVRINSSNQLELAAGNGTAYTTVASAAALTAPTSAVVQAWDDGVNLNVRIGSGPVASVARPAVSAGTAGFTVGQDNGASSGYFNGRICSTVYRKDSAPTLAQRDAVAAYQRLQARFA